MQLTDSEKLPLAEMLGNKAGAQKKCTMNERSGESPHYSSDRFRATFAQLAKAGEEEGGERLQARGAHRAIISKMGLLKTNRQKPGRQWFSGMLTVAAPAVFKPYLP
jgi:hypothetical protein